MNKPPVKYTPYVFFLQKYYHIPYRLDLEWTGWGRQRETIEVVIPPRVKELANFSVESRRVYAKAVPLKKTPKKNLVHIIELVKDIYLTAQGEI